MAIKPWKLVWPIFISAVGLSFGIAGVVLVYQNDTSSKYWWGWGLTLASIAITFESASSWNDVVFLVGGIDPKKIQREADSDPKAAQLYWMMKERFTGVIVEGWSLLLLGIIAGSHWESPNKEATMFMVLAAGLALIPIPIWLVYDTFAKYHKHVHPNQRVPSLCSFLFCCSACHDKSSQDDKDDL